MSRPNLPAACAVQDDRTCRLGIITTHISPARGYGGIAEASARLAQGWGCLGYAVAICSSDASEGGRLVIGDLNLPAGASIHLYRSYGWPRWGFGLGAIAAICRTFRAADAVYISGVGTWPTSLAPFIGFLFRKPMTIAVHGGLMPGHVAYIRTTKPLKWLFYRAITFPCLRRAHAIHATSEIEAEGVRQVLPGVPLAIVANAVDLSTWALQPPRPPGPGMVIGYVGRLSPEKGILPFLQAWLRCRQADDRLLIAGTGAGAYADAVMALIRQAGDAIQCLGYVPADCVKNMLAGCDYLVLPSGLGEGGLRENFGNVVVEAMALGRPVLVSRGMAWDGVEEAGIGFAFDPDGVEDALLRAAALSADQWLAMSRAARAFVETRFDIKDVAAQLLPSVLGP